MFFGDAHVERAVEATAGCAALLERYFPGGQAGRPRLLTVTGLLAGMHLACTESGGAVHLERAAHILAWQIPARWRLRFGMEEALPRTAPVFEAVYGRVRRLFHATERLMDPSPLPKNRRLSEQEVQQYTAADDPGRRQAAADLLLHATNALVEASLAPIRTLMDAYWDGSLAADGTACATFARPAPPGSPVTCLDPDAAWYIRDGDHKDTTPTGNGSGSGSGSGKSTTGGQKKAKAPRKKLFGYEATLAPLTAHRCRPLPHLPAGTRLPSVIVGFTLDKPGHKPGINAVRVLTDIARRGHAAGGLAVDRAFNNSQPDDFQLPVRALGYQVAYDYPTTALGVQDGGPNGEILLEGTWACPHTPPELIHATKELHQRTWTANTTSTGSTGTEQEKEKARAAWTQKIERRQAFLLRPHGRPDAGGHQRYRCPAEAGTVRCPIKPGSLRGKANRPKIDAEPGPFGPPKICTQHSVTLPPQAGAKHWQPHPYGTPAWQDAYQPGRATVEGVNGHAKDGAHENLAAASGRRIRGLAAQTFLMAFQLAHANTRKIKNWQDTLPAQDAEPRKRPPRRRTKPLATWTPRGYHQPQPSDGDAPSQAGPAPP